MSVNEQIQGEIDQWNEFNNRCETLAKDYQTIIGTGNQLVSDLQNEASTFESELQGIENRIVTLSEIIVNTTQRLSALPEKLNNTIEEACNAVESAVEEVNDIAEEGLAVLQTETLRLQEQIADFLVEAKEEIENFAEADFFEEVKETAREELSNVEEMTTDLLDHAAGEIQATKDQVLEDLDFFLEKFGDGFEEWKSAVQRVRQAYDDIGNSINGVGETIERLSSSLQLAMETSSGGLQAAAQSIDDIKAVMDGIA